MKYTPLLCCLVLAACGGSETTSDFGVSTSSGFVTPDRSGRIQANLAQTSSGGDVDFSGNGYGYQVGVRNQSQLVAVAGVTPRTTVSPLPSLGTGQYTGTFEMVSARFSGGFGPNVTQFSPSRDDGRMTVTVNYDTGAFEGNADLIGGVSLSGRVNGMRLTGTATNGTIDGELTGLVGGDRAVGAFHGANSARVFSGGFYVNRDDN